MSPQSQPLAPNPSLLAILLVTRSRNGPRLISHYPPSSSQTYQQQRRHHSSVERTNEVTDDDAADSSDTSCASWDEDFPDGELSGEIESIGLERVDRTYVRGSGSTRANGLQRRRSPMALTSRTSSSINLPRKASKHDTDASNEGSQHNEAQRSWDTMFSWSTDGLVKLLAPTSRKWHKKIFELCMEDKCFLGCPMFEKEDGGWGSPRNTSEASKKKNEGNRDDSTVRSGNSSGSPDLSSGGIVTREHESDQDLKIAAEFADNNQDYVNHEVSVPQDVEPRSLASTSMTSRSSDIHQHPANLISLTMFNLVFVIRPSRLEHRVRVKEMFENIVKTFAKALQYLQREEGYVWKEARIMYGVKEKARENGTSYAATWPTLASNSSLARAIATTFDRISASEIAHLSLGTSLDISLQIPLPRSTPFVPTPFRQQVTGLQLTTFDPTYSVDNEIHRPNSPDLSPKSPMISPYSAVLLLRSPDKLIKGFIANDGSSMIDPALAGPLSYFIKQVKPTKTLMQMSRITRGHISLPDLLILAQHLIHYRCAIAIPPIHPSQIYVPSPNADMRRFREASSEFAARFVSLPSLPALLAKLGRTFQPYSTLIPSSDHKEPYMEILAWMVKGGWLVQLRTFAWVYVSRDIKAKVEARRIQEERDAEAVTASVHIAIEEEDEEGDDEEGDEHADGTSEVEDVRLSEVSSADSRASMRKITDESTIVSAFPPRLKEQLEPARPASQAGSASSGITAVPLLTSKDRSSIRHGTGSRQGSGSSQSQAASKSRIWEENSRLIEEHAVPDASNFEPSIILSPHKADALESKWLEEIGASLPDEDVRIAWPKLLKYFDGKHAIEEIAMQEGLKRKVVTPILTKLMGKEGVLQIVRHW